MSVLLETSQGEIVIDLFYDKAPKTCENFLKLCKIKYYNFSPIHTVRKNALLQGGDPIGPHSKDSDGGCSIWGVIAGGASSPRRTFNPEYHKSLKHAEMGTVSMATAPSPTDPSTRTAASQFIITLGPAQHYLDGDAAIFGHVVEGFDVLDKLNSSAGVFVDRDSRPLQDIRILHTHVLDEASIPDPSGMPSAPPSPPPTPAQLANQRIPHDEPLSSDLTPEEADKLRRAREARQQALTLEMVGDLPFAEAAPPENVLFVCKLNPVTRDEDLELIFARFGRVLSCEVIRDKRTGDSLQYAFVEFADKEACERAHDKMQSVLIDDHRIHVDFSQSVSRLADVWRHKAGRKRAGGGGGGFGGIEGLERKRQFKADVDEERDGRNGGRGYGMVFDRHRDDHGRRGRSPDGRDRRAYERPRSRSRSPRRKHDDDHRRRSRSRGERERERRRSADRHHDDRRRR